MAPGEISGLSLAHLYISANLLLAAAAASLAGIRALSAALPDFDTASLSLDPLHRGQGSIAFTGEIELNNRQLSLLELR